MSEHSQHIDIRVGSEKSFGLVFGAVFFAISIWLFFKEYPSYLVPFFIAVVLVILSFLRPSVFRVPNKLWFKLGMLLGAIITPIVMLAVYAIAIVPLGLLFKARGKDLLKQKPEPGLDSYWIERSDDMQSMKKQF